MFAKTQQGKLHVGIDSGFVLVFVDDADAHAIQTVGGITGVPLEPISCLEQIKIRIRCRPLWQGQQLKQRQGGLYNPVFVADVGVKADGITCCHAAGVFKFSRGEHHAVNHRNHVTYSHPINAKTAYHGWTDVVARHVNIWGIKVNNTV